jgi:hypothetical protein
MSTLKFIKGGVVIREIRYASLISVELEIEVAIAFTAKFRCFLEQGQEELYVIYTCSLGVSLSRS